MKTGKLYVQMYRKQDWCVMKFVPYRFRQWLIFALLLIGGAFVHRAYAGLSNSIKNAIYTAYANGYVAALKMDIQRIQEIKSDDAMMKKVVLDAARKYVQVVEQMN